MGKNQIKTTNVRAPIDIHIQQLICMVETANDATGKIKKQSENPKSLFKRFFLSLIFDSPAIPASGGFCVLRIPIFSAVSGDPEGLPMPLRNAFSIYRI